MQLATMTFSNRTAWHFQTELRPMAELKFKKKREREKEEEQEQEEEQEKEETQSAHRR